MVYRHTISDIDQLKRVLIDCWAQLSQETLNRTIDQLPKRLMMDITTPLLRELHWLKVQERIQFRLCSDASLPT